MNISIVTDSTCDLLPDTARELQIEIVPNLLMIENKAYLDGAGMTRDEFYARLPHYRHPTSTAAPSPDIYSEVYERHLSSGADYVLSFHPSRQLSALFDVATLAAAPFGEQVQVVDSDNISLGLGFQVLNAARLARKGGSLEEILRLVESVRQRIRVYAMFDTLVYARRSGRVHWLTASLGSMLGLRAVIEIRSGIVHRLGLMRNRSQGLAGLKKVLQASGRLEEAAILFTTPLSQADADYFLGDLPRMDYPVLHIPITPIVGSHVGPGCVGFGLVLAQA